MIVKGGCKAEQITCGSTQTYEHNTYSPLRKSTLQQSKQEAKVMLQPAQWKYWSEQFLKMYLLSELPWRLHFKCKLKPPSIAVANVSHTIFQNSNLSRRTSLGMNTWTEYHFRECPLREKKLNVYTEQTSPLLHLSRRGDTVHKSNIIIKPPRDIWNQCTGCHFGLH